MPVVTYNQWKHDPRCLEMIDKICSHCDLKQNDIINLKSKFSTFLVPNYEPIDELPLMFFVRDWKNIKEVEIARNRFEVQAKIETNLDGKSYCLLNYGFDYIRDKLFGVLRCDLGTVKTQCIYKSSDPTP